MAYDQIWRPRPLPKPLEEMSAAELQDWYDELMDMVGGRERERIEAPGQISTEPFTAARQHVYRRLLLFRTGS